MAGIDLSKFKKPEKKYLSADSRAPIANTFRSGDEEGAMKEKTKNKKPKEVKKVGRPTAGKEHLSRRFSLAFTESEYENLNSKAGRVPLAVYIRDALKEAKII